MKKIPTAIIFGIFLACVAAFVIYPVWSQQAPVPTLFKPIKSELVVGLLGWLFVVALFVERAVEVVVMVFRDQQADLLGEAEALAAKKLAAVIEKAASLADNDPGKAAATNEVQAASASLETVRHEGILYRAGTKAIAMLVSFAFGVFISLAGIRALSGLLQDEAAAGKLFTAADILITGAVLAGGSEGIHRMANAVTSFMDALSARGDKAQRIANQDAQTK